MTKKRIRLGPDSAVQKKFLDCTSDLVIYGGGETFASTLKTTL